MNDDPALALVEFSSIAFGTRAADALAKKAHVTIIRAGSVQPGKFAVMFSGEVAAVEESFVEACRVGADSVLDRILLPDVHPQVKAAALGRQGEWTHDTLGIIETSTLAAILEAADAAVKGAHVEMVQLRLGDGLGGKGLAHFAGIQADVEAAVEIGCARIAHRNLPCWKVVIPRADEHLLASRSKSTRFGEGW